jgi:CheY-like chemotaxis protein
MATVAADGYGLRGWPSRRGVLVSTSTLPPSARTTRFESAVGGRGRQRPRAVCQGRGLPLARRARTAAWHAVCGRQNPAGVKRILVVDDEPGVRLIVGQALESEGYAVATASNGVEALAKLYDCRPDGVLLDLHMPVLDGEGFLRACRSDPALEDLSVAICSTSSDTAHLAGAYDVHVVLQKPFHLDTLFEAVRHLLKDDTARSPLNPVPDTHLRLCRRVAAETRAWLALLAERLELGQRTRTRSLERIAASRACLEKVAVRMNTEARIASSFGRLSSWMDPRPRDA